MDFDFDPDIENFSNSIQKMLTKRDSDIRQSMAKIETNCYNTAKEDVDSFVKCMSPALKNVEKEEVKLELRLTFIEAKAAECFIMNKGNTNMLKECHDNASSNFESQLNNFLRNISEYK